MPPYRRRDQPFYRKRGRRIAVIVDRRSRCWKDSWENPAPVILLAIELLNERLFMGIRLPIPHPSLSYLLVSTERWANRTVIIFDVFHGAYNCIRAHIPGENDLPVVQVNLSRTFEVQAKSPIEDSINESVRVLHNRFGWRGRPPYKIDHTSPTPVQMPEPRII